MFSTAVCQVACCLTLLSLLFVLLLPFIAGFSFYKTTLHIAPLYVGLPSSHHTFVLCRPLTCEWTESLKLVNILMSFCSVWPKSFDLSDPLLICVYFLPNCTLGTETCWKLKVDIKFARIMCNSRTSFKAKVWGNKVNILLSVCANSWCAYLINDFITVTPYFMTQLSVPVIITCPFLLCFSFCSFLSLPVTCLYKLLGPSCRLPTTSPGGG